MLNKFLGSLVCTVFMSSVYLFIGAELFGAWDTSSVTNEYILLIFAGLGAGIGILTGLLISFLTGGRKPILVGAITSLALWVFLITCHWLTKGGSFDALRIIAVLAVWSATGAFGGLGYKLIPQNTE
jgi:hypothetical protein